MAKFSLLVAFCLAAPVFAAVGDSGELQALTDRARAVPAEFAADALLRIADLPPLDQKQKRALIEEAFDRAAGAQYWIKLRAGSLRLRTGPAAFLDKAYAQDLDRTSLQCRAVRAMLPLDGRKAREMFGEVPRLRLTPRTCDDPLVYDVSTYYETLAQLVAKAFTPAEVAKDEPLQLLNAYVQGLQSPVEAGPVAHLLATVPLKADRLSGLIMSYAAALKELAGDDRSFSFTASRYGRTAEQIGELAARCEKLNIPAVPLLEAYRAYLVRHLHGQRCADGTEKAAMAFGMPNSPEQEGTTDVVRHFNETLRPEQMKAIGEDEMQPAKVEGTASGLKSCESPECGQISKLYAGLIFSPEGLPFGPEKRATAEWQGKLKEYLAALAAWKDDSSATTGEQFHQKTLFYSDTFNLVPDGADRAAVIRAFVDFLQRNSYQRESRVEWFLPVNSLIARMSLDPGLAGILNELRNSQNPVISLYVALEQLAPRPPGTRISIM